MNPYDLDTEITMQENKGTLFAGKVYRERKCYQVLMILWLVVILGMRFPFRKLLPEVAPVLYIGLFTLGCLAIFCFYYAAMQRDRRKLSGGSLSRQERHDYDLAMYRKMHKRKGVQRNIFLLTMAKLDLLMEDGTKAKLALDQIDAAVLEKKMLKSYHFFLAAASWLERDDAWKIQLEQCLAIPVKSWMQSDEKIRHAFEEGKEQLLKMVESWNWVYQGDSGKAVIEGSIMGTISLISTVFLGVQMFIWNGSFEYMLFSVIAVSLLSIVWIIWMTYLIFQRFADVRKMDIAENTKKASKISYVAMWIIFILCILYICFVGIIEAFSRHQTAAESLVTAFTETQDTYEQ